MTISVIGKNKDDELGGVWEAILNKVFPGHLPEKETCEQRLAGR